MVVGKYVAIWNQTASATGHICAGAVIFIVRNYRCAGDKQPATETGLRRQILPWGVCGKTILSLDREPKKDAESG